MPILQRPKGITVLFIVINFIKTLDVVLCERRNMNFLSLTKFEMVLLIYLNRDNNELLIGPRTIHLFCVHMFGKLLRDGSLSVWIARIEICRIGESNWKRIRFERHFWK